MKATYRLRESFNFVALSVFLIFFISSEASEEIIVPVILEPNIHKYKEGALRIRPSVLGKLKYG